MSWGVCFLYYRCPRCGCLFKYATDMIPVFAENFGCCPDCGTPGTLLYDGARTPDDALYTEVEE